MNSWKFMWIHVNSCEFMGVHGCSWVFMGVHGCSCEFMWIHVLFLYFFHLFCFFIFSSFFWLIKNKKTGRYFLVHTIRTGNFKWVHAPMVVKIFCCRRRKPNSCQKLPTIIYMINKKWVCTTYTINSPEFVNTYKVSTSQIFFKIIFSKKTPSIRERSPSFKLIEKTWNIKGTPFLICFENKAPTQSLSTRGLNP